MALDDGNKPWAWVRLHARYRVASSLIVQAYKESRPFLGKNRYFL
jgi:hypothetical protein